MTVQIECRGKSRSCPGNIGCKAEMLEAFKKIIILCNRLMTTHIIVTEQAEMQILDVGANPHTWKRVSE